MILSEMTLGISFEMPLASLGDVHGYSFKIPMKMPLGMTLGIPVEIP